MPAWTMLCVFLAHFSLRERPLQNRAALKEGWTVVHWFDASEN